MKSQTTARARANWFLRILENDAAAQRLEPSVADLEQLHGVVKGSRFASYLDAEDQAEMAQEIALQISALRGCSPVPRAHAPSAYLSRMVRNQAIDQLRRHQRYQRWWVEQIAQPTGSSWCTGARPFPNTEAQVTLNELTSKVQNSCTPLECEVWSLRAQQDWKFDEIASHLHLSMGQVGGHFFRMRRELERWSSSRRAARRPAAQPQLLA